MKNLIKFLITGALVFTGIFEFNTKQANATSFESEKNYYYPTNLFVSATAIENDKIYTNAIKFISALPKGTNANKNSSNEYNVGLKFEFKPFETLPETIGGTRFYLKPNLNWKSNGARFAMYLSNNVSEEVWVNMTDENTDGIYETTAPEGNWTKIIFCRMDGESSINSWDYKWNQTNELTYDPSVGNCYKIENGTWDNGNGTWSIKTNVESKIGYYTCANLSSISEFDDTMVGYEVEIFFAAIITGIPTTYNNGTVSVTPAYQALNGDTIYGVTSVFTISITSNGIILI